MAEVRARILLRAALELLKKQDKSTYVLNLLEETSVYDEAVCDGYCLMNDISDYLENGV